MIIRVFNTINLTAHAMQSAMVGNMLSARVMLVRIGALYARGRARTMPDFHEKFLWLKRCVTWLRQNLFYEKMNDLDAEIFISAAVTMQSSDAETHSEPFGCTAQDLCALRRPKRCADAMLLNSLRRPSGCLRKRRKYSAGHQNANVRLSKPVIAKCLIQHFKEHSAKITHYLGSFAKIGVLF